MLSRGWWGTWVGPEGGATRGTFAMICDERSADGWVPSKRVAGPLKVF